LMGGDSSPLNTQSSGQRDASTRLWHATRAKAPWRRSSVASRKMPMVLRFMRACKYGTKYRLLKELGDGALF